MRSIVALFLSMTVALSVLGQPYGDSAYKQKFNKADALIYNGAFMDALPMLEEIHANDSTIANINYMLGVCHLQGTKNFQKAIRFFENASKDVSKDYSLANWKEKKAPGITYLYLGRAYHYLNDFERAVSNYYNYRSFIDVANIETYNKVRMVIKHAENAIELVAAPVKVKLVNLGSEINSPFADYAPVISADGQSLFFTSNRPGGVSDVKDKDGAYFDDIYVSTKQPNGKWGRPNLVAGINTAGNESAAGITPDGQTLFIFKGDNSTGNLYFSELKENAWGTVAKVGSDVSSAAKETSATVSVDGDILIFSSNRSGGYGGSDLWFSSRLPDGSWSLAKNMGSIVNTQYDEESPFLGFDGKTLFFSSQGHSSMGGFDIFRSELINGAWSEPQNLGYPINTSEDDLHFVLSADGETAYLSARREGGLGDTDIYTLRLDPKKSDAMAVVRGEMLVPANDYVKLKALISVKNAAGSIVGTFRPNRRSGRYVLLLSPGETYSAEYLVEGYEAVTKTIAVASNAVYSETSKPIEVESVAFGAELLAIQAEKRKAEETARALALKAEKDRRLAEEARLKAEADAEENARQLALQEDKGAEVEKARLMAEIESESAKLELQIAESEAKLAEEARLAQEKAAADAARQAELAAEAKKAEEVRLAQEAAAKKAAADAARQAELAAEAKKAEEARLAQEAAAKKAAAEAARQAELAAEAKKAEEARLAQEAAAKKAAADAAREAELAAEAKKAEEARLAQEAAAKKAAADAARQAELAAEAKKVEEVRLAQEIAAKKAEEARLAQEAAAKKAAADAAREAELEAEAKKAEEARLAQEAAAKKRATEMESAVATSTSSSVSDKDDEALKRAALQKRLEELKRKKAEMEETLSVERQAAVAALEQRSREEAQRQREQEEQSRKREEQLQAEKVRAAKEAEQEEAQQKELAEKARAEELRLATELAASKAKEDAARIAEASERAKAEAAAAKAAETRLAVERKAQEVAEAKAREEAEKAKAETASAKEAEIKRAEELKAQQQKAEEKAREADAASRAKTEASKAAEARLAEERKARELAESKAREAAEAKNAEEQNLAQLSTKKSGTELSQTEVRGIIEANRKLMNENESLRSELALINEKLDIILAEMKRRNQSMELPLETYSEDAVQALTEGKKLILQNILFDYNKARLRGSSELELDKLAAFLLRHPDINLTVAGHTDALGEAGYNLRLSRARAEAVVNHLVSKGVASSRLKSVGYGQTRPIARNSNPDGADNPLGRQLNRRIEISVTGGDADLIEIREEALPDDLRSQP